MAETTLVIAALKVVGYGIGTLGPGIGLGLCGYGLCVGSARQPELAGKLFTNALIFGALAEALALIGLVAAFIF
jgi:F-type H+-transporting ATPase subunit c